MNELIEREILKDEKVLWYGQPDRNIMFHAADLFLIPFAVFWCGFMAFWEYKLWTLLAEGEIVPVIVFMVFGIPFILIGLYMLFGRFFWDRYRKARTHYYVTDKRVIVIKDVFNRTICAQFLSNLPCINKIKRKDGSGTLRFGNTPLGYVSYSNDLMDQWPVNAGQDVPVFHDLNDVDIVYDIVNRVREGKR
jgi:hypothetical protein